MMFNEAEHARLIQAAVRLYTLGETEAASALIAYVMRERVAYLKGEVD